MTTQGLRKPEKALTAQFVKTAHEPGKYFDGHGLFLRVQPNGARQWVQRIVIRGKRCELGLGNPALVSLWPGPKARLPRGWQLAPKQTLHKKAPPIMGGVEALLGRNKI